MAPLGSQIRDARKHSDMGQAELAAALSVSVPTISEWENGRKFPNKDRIQQMSKILNVKFEIDEETYGNIAIMPNKLKEYQSNSKSKPLMAGEIVALESTIEVMKSAFQTMKLALEQDNENDRKVMAKLADQIMITAVKLKEELQASLTPEYEAAVKARKAQLEERENEDSEN